MSKLLGATSALVLLAAAVAIGSLVINILILNKVNDLSSSTDTVTTAAPEVSTTTAAPCQVYGDVSKNPDWKDAADRLLKGLDRSVDPCTDFYQYTCGKYIREADLNGGSRIGTYDEAQVKVNLLIADALDKLPTDASATEKLAKKAYQACLGDAKRNSSAPDVITEKLTSIKADLLQYLGLPIFGLPRNGGALTDMGELFSVMGRMEQQFVGGPLLTSIVTSDYKNKSLNALYVSQPSLSFPRDYYVLPQFISELQAYQESIEDLLKAISQAWQVIPFCADTKVPETCIARVAAGVVDLERQIAMASWPDTEMRNYKQQYNPFKIDELPLRFPNIRLDNYVNALVNNSGIQRDFNTVLQQHSYFLWLDALFAGGARTTTDFVNYLAIQFLMSATGNYGLDFSSNRLSERIEPYAVRRGFGIRRIKPTSFAGHAAAAAAFTANADDASRSGCVNLVTNYMPYATGYIYTKLRTDRNKVAKDVQSQTENIIQSFSEMIDTLPWMSAVTKQAAHNKSAQLVRNYLWPQEMYQDFKNTTNLDNYHTQDYVLPDTNALYWETLKALSKGMEKREFFRLLSEDGNRKNFLQSPATVNAWYQPERNSITFPFAILNPPYYKLEFPQAYNYAGQGGTGGHELTHGYDDEGVQFGPEGELAACEFTHCGIMDDDSRKGFVDMAQCVVTQYNGKCCPLKSGNVRCVNGATTQGENIADLGGQLAAYRAYKKWVGTEKTEDLLPGLQDFTPQQIFWITYGFSWCMKITDPRLTKQLLTDPHAPSSCRVNQVMQDIPEFGHDFNCKRGTELFPKDDDRCKVWIGF